MARKKVALVLSGGGARGAYQAGILKAWENMFKNDVSLEILCGVSAGAINAMQIVQNADNMFAGIQKMNAIWLNLHTGDIFESDFRAVVKNLFRLTRSSRKTNPSNEDLAAGGILNTSPLYQFLIKHIDMAQVHRQLSNHPQMSLAINCFDYSEMKNVTFYQTSQGIKPWDNPGRRGEQGRLTIKHVMASCAVPFLFPPINIDGHYYGDGSLRNMTPLSSPIKLGAERIISINLKGIISNSGPEDIPNIGQIAGSVLDSMFMDAIDYDSWVMSRMNSLTEKIPVEKRDTKVIDFCRISPLANLGELAEKFRHKFPRSLRYLLGSWISSELLSYLLFDKDFSEVLIEQGMKDGKLYYDIIEEWLSDKG